MRTTIILIQNLLNAYLLSYFCCIYADVEQNKRFDYYCVFIPVYTLLSSIIRILFEYTGPFYMILGSTIFLLMMLFRNRQLSAVNILVFVLLWIIISCFCQQITMLLISVPFQYDFELFVHSDLYPLLFFPEKMLVFSALLLIGKISGDGKDLPAGYPLSFLLIYTFLSAIMLVVEIMFMEYNYYLFQYFTVGCGIFLVSLITYYLYVKTSYDHELQLQNNELSHQLSRIKDISRIHHEETERVKIIRHDLQNQYRIIKAYLENGNTDDAINIIDQSVSSLEQTAGISSTGFTAIDAIITSKLQYAHSLGIKTFVAIELHDISKEYENGIAMIIAVLLDNAIENNSASDPYINFVIRQNNGISITIRNHTETDDDSLKTKKENPEVHGFGLKSVSLTVSSLRGSMLHLLDNGSFTVFIKLP